MHRRLLCALAATTFCSAAVAASPPSPHPELDEMIARHARIHGIPEHLVHRVVIRESRYHPSLVHRRFYGLMQITYETAKSMGYKGAPRGLLDPDVNLTYGVPYLANAYRMADGDENRAVALYTGGYYYVAKRKKMLGQLRNAASASLAPPPAPAPVPQEPPNPVMQLLQFVAGPAQANPAQADTPQASPPQADTPQATAASPAAPAQAGPVPQAAAAHQQAAAAPQAAASAEAAAPAGR